MSIAAKTNCDDSNYAVKCTGDAWAGATKATRMEDFVTNFVTNNVFSDICTTDLPSALSKALEAMEVACNVFVPPE